MLDGLAKLNARTAEQFGDPETRTRIAQYEMAFRMQSSVPDLVDLSKETKATLEVYGPSVSEPGSFAHSALMARRLVERGVRVVQILHRGWDQHGNLPKDLGNQCEDTDQATAALLGDLKRLGLLDRRSWSGAASSAARSIHRARCRRTTTAATTTRETSACGWPAAASKAG